jgi:hypothetical protein
MLRLTPVASVFAGTLIAFGLDPEGLIVTVIEADLVGSAWLVAVMVTGLLPVGRAAGALYVTRVAVPPVIVPIVELPLVTVPASVPATVQVTAVLEVFVTEAVRGKVPFTGTVRALAGLAIETVTAAGVAVVVVVPPAPKPTVAISRLKPIARTHALRRRPRVIHPAPIKPEVRVDSFDINRTQNCSRLVRNQLGEQDVHRRECLTTPYMPLYPLTAC